MTELKILDFDIENRPISYAGNDFTFSDVTAIAASFGLDCTVKCWLTRYQPTEAKVKDQAVRILTGFRRMYDAADIVTGHYILRHDLPIINGWMMEVGLPPLAAKLASDTKVHSLKAQGVSKSQENLGAMYAMEAPKVHMNQHLWRSANRLTREGLESSRKRVVGDVRQHQELRLKMIEAGFLGAPQVWRP